MAVTPSKESPNEPRKIRDINGVEYASLSAWWEAVGEKASDPATPRYSPTGPRLSQQVARSKGARNRDVAQGAASYKAEGESA